MSPPNNVNTSPKKQSVDERFFMPRHDSSMIMSPFALKRMPPRSFTDVRKVSPDDISEVTTSPSDTTFTPLASPVHKEVVKPTAVRGPSWLQCILLFPVELVLWILAAPLWIVGFVVGFVVGEMMQGFKFGYERNGRGI